MDLNQEKELIESIKAGDKNAFEILFNRYKDLVYSVCCRFIEDKDDANDISQDIFIKLYHSLGSFQYNSKFSTWIYKICVNHCLNILRKKKRNRILSLDYILEKFGWEMTPEFEDKSTNPEKNFEKNEELEIFQKALRDLPEKQKAALILNKFDGLKNSEISKIMDCPLSTVDSLIFRAKKNISEKIIQYSGKKNASFKDF
jgi:RNA polymerase sigma-70 factor, ECF subfamily